MRSIFRTFNFKLRYKFGVIGRNNAIQTVRRPWYFISIADRKGVMTSRIENLNLVGLYLQSDYGYFRLQIPNHLAKIHGRVREQANFKNAVSFAGMPLGHTGESILDIDEK